MKFFILGSLSVHASPGFGAARSAELPLTLSDTRATIGEDSREHGGA